MMLKRKEHEEVSVNLTLVAEPGYSEDIYDLVKERSIISLWDYQDPEHIEYDGLDCEIKSMVDSLDQLNFFTGGPEEHQYAGMDPDAYHSAIHDVVTTLTSDMFRKNAPLIDSLQQNIKFQDADALFNANGIFIINIKGTRT